VLALLPRGAERWGQEAAALMELAVYAGSLVTRNATPGMALLNLRFRRERETAPPAEQRTGVEGPGFDRGRAALSAAALAASLQGWRLLQSRMAVHGWGTEGEHSWRRRAWALARRAEDALQLASLLHLLAFLRYGTYRSLPERALGARLVYAQPRMVHAVSFDFLNRNLVWSELAELMLLLPPVLRAARAHLGPVLRRAIASVGGGGVGGGNGSGGGSRGGGNTKCPVCACAPAGDAHRAEPCGCTYCYYCLHGSCLAQKGFRCARCGAQVTGSSAIRA